MWLKCSGEFGYVQDQLFFYILLSGYSPVCTSPWMYYKTRPHPPNRKSLHWGFLVSAKGHRIVDLFLPRISQGEPQDDGNFRAMPLLPIDSRLRCRHPRRPRVGTTSRDDVIFRRESLL